ncbi:hypothetical protein IDH44_22550 [Paenibacillus sp. IB182496]|uniref:Uncharacterized protein n=1 Tax=Paenibacillus sabuli TaxID=2772509 RepID=A0A927BY04_9BACL|nr:hypothetical protein [Paenibacillus sabuli]MBD2847986.1 hypothetical protein [Paenibacillus sabuli]
MKKPVTSIILISVFVIGIVFYINTQNRLHENQQIGYLLHAQHQLTASIINSIETEQTVDHIRGQIQSIRYIGLGAGFFENVNGYIEYCLVELDEGGPESVLPTLKRALALTDKAVQDQSDKTETLEAWNNFLLEFKFPNSTSAS